MLICLALVCIASAIAAPNQWDYRVQGTIRVVLPPVTTAQYCRPSIQVHIQRVSPEWYEHGRVAIKIRERSAPLPASVPATIRRTLETFGLRTIEPFIPPHQAGILSATSVGLEQIVIARFDPGFDPFDVAAALAELPEVEYATPLYIRRTYLQPNDPLFSQQIALQRLNLPAAWDITTGSPAVTIAIIDSGTDYEHEDLAANLWTNPGETGFDAQGRDKRTNGIDDDGNGKIDDWRGWDFIGNVTRTEYINGIVREDNDPKVRASTITADMQHGTYTAGAAIASTNNGRGIASPGFRCRFIPIKCGSDDASLSGSVLRGYEAILYAARLGAHVINCSWGGPGGSPLEQQVIDQARALGSFIVVAAGNEGINVDTQPYYPASYRGVFTVGASTSADVPANFSNYGTAVAAFAPGVAIRTTAVNNTYTAVEGTSFAAPLASGIAALLRTLHPDWTLDQIAAQLRYSCDPLSNVSPTNRRLYYGRLNAYRALNANRSFTSGERFPGVQLLRIQVDNGSSIRSTAIQQLQVTVRNLLAPAANVQLSLSVSSNAIVGSSTLSTTQLGTNQERTLTTTIRLTEPVYFFDGSVQLTLTINADGIVEYASVSIPISLPTQNTYTRIVSDLPHTFVAIATRGLSGVWAIGRTPSNRPLIVRSSGAVFDSSSISGTPTTIGIASASTVCIGTGNGQVWRTTNSGSTWSSTSVSSITPSVQGIVFFDATRGILIGQPAGSVWRICRTSDAGATWHAAETLPSPISGEQTSHHAITTLGDTIWIGTTAGRMLRSTDRGVRWTVTTVATSAGIISTTFSRPNLGYCLARLSGGQERYTVFRTTDGGLTWTSVGATFSAPGPLPQVLYAPPRSRFLFALCAGSQVLRSSDSAATWEPVLTGNGITMTAGFGTASGQTATLYMAGRTLASLRVSIAEDRPLLQATPSDTLDFGAVQLDAATVTQWTLRNTGNATLQLSSFVLQPITATTGEFDVLDSAPLSIEPNATRTLAIRFRPRAAGQRLARLVVQTNADPPSYSIILQGIGMPLGSVQQEESSPCPVIQQGTTLVASCTCNPLRLRLWNISGEHIDAVPLGTRQLMLDLAGLAAGAYFYRFECDDGQYFCGVLLVTK